MTRDPTTGNKIEKIQYEQDKHEILTADMGFGQTVTNRPDRMEISLELDNSH